MNDIVVEQAEDQLDKELESVQEEETSEETESSQEAEIPEKFKNKSVEDIIKAYQNLESEYGRRSNEVGELRKLTDELLGLQLKNKKEEEEEAEPISSDQLFDNPKQVIDSVVQSNPKIKALEEQIRLSQIQSEKQKFEAKHPDWQDIMTSSDFQKWIQSSPVRAKMLIEADQNYDYQTGAELLDLYKEITKTNISKKKEEIKSQIKSDLKDSQVEKGSTGQSSKKIYRRADLIKLRMRDPERFEAMQEEIIAAYREGRVK